jgi:hypothetical protein
LPIFYRGGTSRNANAIAAMNKTATIAVTAPAVVFAISFLGRFKSSGSFDPPCAKTDRSVQLQYSEIVALIGEKTRLIL